MLSKRLLAILSVLVVMSLAILACGGGGGSPTEAPATRTPRATEEEVQPTEEEQPTEEPTEEAEPTDEEQPTEEAEPTEEGQGIVAGEVQVTSLYGYTDEYDYFHVVGLVYNDTEDPVTSIELTLELTDGNGDTVLTDSDDEPVDSVTFSPFLYTIAQGETTPFDYYISTEGDTSDWQGTVTVTDYSTGDVDRAEVEVVNDHVSVDQYGTIWLTGELVNDSDEPVLVNSLAGALVATDGTALAADASYTVARYLAPNGDENGNDRTPFSISLDGPADDADSSVFYFDVDRTDPVEVPTAVSIDITNAFIDDFDNLHILSNVTNNGDQVLSVSLVAGLYDADGAVLDAATASAPVYVYPGATVPVSFEYFSAVNGDSDLISNVDSYTVQVDGYWTYETSFDSVPLETSDDSYEPQDGYLTFTGNVVNSTEDPLSSVTVVVAIYDAEDNLFASGWTYVYPEEDSIAAGESDSYEVTIYVPSDLDTSDFTFATFAQGYPAN